MKQTITHRFLRYLILIIISSNLLVAIFLYGIMRENAMRQARDMRQNLMESNLTMMQQYFEIKKQYPGTLLFPDIFQGWF